MRGFTYIETTPEVVAVLFASHREQLKPFGSFSDPEGNDPFGNGNPQMVTTYGLEGSDFAILELKTTWEHGEIKNKRYNQITEQWLLIKEAPDE